MTATAARMRMREERRTPSSLSLLPPPRLSHPQARFLCGLRKCGVAIKEAPSREKQILRINTYMCNLKNTGIDDLIYKAQI